MNPDQLTTAPLLIQKCANTKLVFPLDIKPTTLCIVGESLGPEEETHEEYFIGKSGKLLDKLLKEVGLIRQIIHITNVVKVKIPSTPDKEAYLNSINLSIQDFIPYLKEELDRVKPTIILALGALALKILTNETEISKWRGSVLDCTLTTLPTPVLATFHPAYLARGQMALYPYVRHDIKRFAERAFSIESEDDSYEQLIDPSLTQVLDYLHDIHQNSTSTCFDIETVAKQRITCIGWTKNPNSAICIPFRHQGLKNRWQKHEQIIILNAMKEVYARPGLTKIAQELHYDAHFLLPLLGFPREPIFDTKYAHALIHPDARHDLGFLTSIYTKMSFHKDEAKDWEEKNLPHDQTLWEYNIKDVITTHRIYEKEKKDLKEVDLYNFFTGYIMPFRRVLFEMEHKGMNIDVEQKDAWTKFVEEEELPIAQDILNKITGRELNPNSSKQIGEYLESLGLPVARTEKGNFTVKEDKLEELIARYPVYRKMLKQILCTRVLKSKDLGTYLKANVSTDNRMRTSYGTDKTGRLSSKANHRGEGTNIQNQPKKFRTYYIPDKDQVLLAPDLAQAEAFVFVYKARAEKLKQRMLKGEKIHAIVANWMHDKPIAELTSDQYRDVKGVVFSSTYGVGINKLATIMERSVAEAKVIKQKYDNVVPEVATYQSDVDKQINETRLMINPYGRRRIFTGFIDSNVLRSGYSQLPQSTVADTINIGILGLWLIKPDDIYISAQVHDEGVISLSPGKVEWFKPYIKAHLETLREIEIEGEILVIPCDIGKVKTNWKGD